MKLTVLAIVVSLMFSLPTFGAESKEYYECKNNCKKECSEQADEESATVKERGGGFWDRVKGAASVEVDCKEDCMRTCNRYKK